MRAKTTNSLRLWLMLAAGLLLVGAFAATALSAKRAKPKTIRVSVKPNGNEVPGSNAEYIAISATGRLMSFEATGNLIAKDKDNEHDVYVYNRVTKKLDLVSVKSNGKPGDADCAASDISPNGRYVSFACDGELTGDDDNDIADVYRHDRKTGKTILISQTSSEDQFNGVDDNSIVSGVANNGIVAWESFAPFVNGDTNTAFDVFVRNPQTGTTKRASLDSEGDQLDGGVDSTSPTKATKIPISANGKVVAFQTFDKATDDPDAPVIMGMDNDVFIRNLGTNTTRRVSLKKNGEEGDPSGGASSGTASISADGRFVAFRADAFNTFSPKDDNTGADIYVKDMKTGGIKLASTEADGTGATESDPQYPEISSTGRYVVWDGYGDWGPGDAYGDFTRDVFRHDMETGKTKLVSAPFKGLHANDNQIADTSNNGWVGFQSMGKLTPKPDDGSDWDVFLRGRIR